MDESYSDKNKVHIGKENKWIIMIKNMISVLRICTSTDIDAI